MPRDPLRLALIGTTLVVSLGCMAPDDENGLLVAVASKDMVASATSSPTPTPAPLVPTPTPTPIAYPTEAPFEFREPEPPGGPAAPPPEPSVDPVTRDPEEGAGLYGSEGDAP